MHQHSQNKLTLQQQQKSILNLTEDRAFSDNMQHLLITNNIRRVLFFGTIL